MTDNQAFKIKTEVFEGPLDLLLHLIEKRKLLINDISLAQVTDEYINFTKVMQEENLGRTSDFVLVASTLLLIKSKSLLPTLELTHEEQSDISDLEKRLKLYKIFKDASVNIEQNFAKKIMFEKLEKANDTIVFSPTEQINNKSLLESVLSVLKSLPKKEKLKEAVVRKVISLEEMIGRLTDRIKNSIQMSFRDFSGYGKAQKVDIIVSFLAMLELVRQDILNVKQEEKYDDIQMETKTISTPSYH
ncbi:segregation/condensation protein A [Candidatus Nomurabacteria bacterium]|nr:segregation/condensation protein A [Candidatus Nomurabacteria bacterium]